MLTSHTAHHTAELHLPVTREIFDARHVVRPEEAHVMRGQLARRSARAIARAILTTRLRVQPRVEV